jgi:uncharacterized SAM-binding protein YcdF (DUF218 family)
MFFTLSKIFWVVVQPLNALCLLALAGFALRLKWRRAGEGVAAGALILILLFGLLPIGPLALQWLEGRVPQATELPADIDGIIVLGGAFEAAQSVRTGQLSANDDIERMFCAAALSKAHPSAKIIFTGGSGDILNQSAREGDDVRAYVALTNLTGKILYEENSRNTYENAIFSKPLAAPEDGDGWVLITSAYHMPRALGVFEKAGWPVIPYPCGYRAPPLRALPSASGNFAALTIFMREVVGLAAYYVTGKSAFLLPPSQLPSEHATAD